MKTIRSCIAASLLLVYWPAHAASFDCSRGHSPAERLICGDPALSALDDTLGRLYRQARRRVAGAQRRALVTDSDTKWAWREANCTDLACLNSWYGARIDELQQTLTAPSTATRPQTLTAASGSPAARGPGEPADMPATHRGMNRGMNTAADAGRYRCTAAEPGMAMHDRCPTLLGQRARWRGVADDTAADWFCGVATLSTADATR